MTRSNAREIAVQMILKFISICYPLQKILFFITSKLNLSAGSAGVTPAAFIHARSFSCALWQTADSAAHGKMFSTYRL